MVFRSFLKPQRLYFFYFNLTCIVGLSVHLIANLVFWFVSPSLARVVVVTSELIAIIVLTWNLKSLSYSTNKFIIINISILNALAVSFYACYGISIIPALTIVFVIILSLLFLTPRNAIFVVIGNALFFLFGFLSNTVFDLFPLIKETTLTNVQSYIYYSVDALGVVLLITLIMRARVVVLEKWNEEYTNSNLLFIRQEEALKITLDKCATTKNFYILLNLEQKMIWCNPQLFDALQIPFGAERTYPEFGDILEKLSLITTLQETICEDYTLITIFPAVSSKNGQANTSTPQD